MTYYVGYAEDPLDAIVHYGRSARDGAPGRGSGRYPLGSGERPRSENNGIGIRERVSRTGKSIDNYVRLQGNGSRARGAAKLAGKAAIGAGAAVGAAYLARKAAPAGAQFIRDTRAIGPKNMAKVVGYDIRSGVGRAGSAVRGAGSRVANTRAVRGARQFVGDTRAIGVKNMAKVVGYDAKAGARAAASRVGSTARGAANRVSSYRNWSKNYASAAPIMSRDRLNLPNQRSMQAMEYLTRGRTRAANRVVGNARGLYNTVRRR